MRRVVLGEFISVDGFAAAPDGDTTFISDSTSADPQIDRDLLEFIGRIDTILLGADTYRMFADYWPEATTDTEIVADALNTTPKVVFSSTLERAPWGEWDDARIVRTDAADAIRSMKEGDGGDMVLWGSLSLAGSLIEEGVIDRYDLFVCPVLLGAGRRLFPDGVPPSGLDLVDSEAYEGGVVRLRYRAPAV